MRALSLSILATPGSYGAQPVVEFRQRGFWRVSESIAPGEMFNSTRSHQGPVNVISAVAVISMFDQYVESSAVPFRRVDAISGRDKILMGSLRDSVRKAHLRTKVAIRCIDV